MTSINLTTNENPSPLFQRGDDDLLVRILIAIACIIVIILALVGNTLVVTVIIRFKQLQNATNYLLLSLAITDITVTCLVMIPATIQDVTQKWIFSKLFCKFYNAFDITCCTASILHLLLVALDRYIAIFKPLKYNDYVRNRYVFLAVCLVWTVSLCLSFIPIFMGWNRVSSDIEPLPPPPPTNDEICSIEANLPYAIISSSLSFWIPFILMTLLYIKIYIVAKRQANAIAQLGMHHRTFSHEASSTQLNTLHLNGKASHNNSLVTSNSTRDILNEKQLHEINRILNENGEPRCSDDRSANAVGVANSTGGDKKSKIIKLLRQLRSIERKRTKDTKAIKTLGIIMGIFIMCWLPFFYMYLSTALTQRPFSLIVDRIITWIGYVNSFINPIIYALTSKDFRKSYLKTLEQVSSHLCPKKFSNSPGNKNSAYINNNSNFKYKNGNLNKNEQNFRKNNKNSWFSFKRSISKNGTTVSNRSKAADHELELDTRPIMTAGGDEQRKESNIELIPEFDKTIDENNNNTKQIVATKQVNFFEDVNSFAYIDNEAGTSDMDMCTEEKKAAISNTKEEVKTEMSYDGKLQQAPLPTETSKKTSKIKRYFSFRQSERDRLASRMSLNATDKKNSNSGDDTDDTKTTNKNRQDDENLTENNLPNQIRNFAYFSLKNKRMSLFTNKNKSNNGNVLLCRV